MIIQASSVSLSAQREYVLQTVETESLRVWKDRPAAAPERSFLPQDTVEIAGSDPAAGTAEGARIRETDEACCDAKTQSLIYLVEKIVEAFTGRKIRIRPFRPEDGGAEGEGNAPAARTAGNGQGRAGWGMEYDATTARYERETVDFQAGGIVRTADGQEIRFDLALQLSREMYEETSVSLRLGDAQAVDPLVINFDGNAAGLSDAKFAFDLDADGTQESISMLEPGSGFLAFDALHTGTVADGSQLFGPGTGNGFAELSALDSDGNGWIDETDPAFSDLRIWTKDSSGADRLDTLQERNVGAIFLGNLETSYDLLGAGGRENGELARLGVWLAEDGKAAGVVSQVDLAV